MELIISVGFPNGNVSLKCDDFDEAEAARGWLGKQGFLPALDVPTPPPTEQPITAEAEKETPKAPAKSKSTAKREAVQKAEPAAVDTAPAATIQDVTKAVTDYAAAQGPTEARALFARFGVSRGGDLKPEQFAEFVATAVDYTARGIKATDAELPEGSETVDELM
ncbi:hypothetical protein P0D88_34965 [Paraburkholderia sp. RL18-103-BIB-C]|uniref:hypothetical protein n=1 Tax=Paraburkholderia sp. RL18-103-BIB-C TaxID=3031637 RepID=UPI0038B7FCBF